MDISSAPADTTADAADSSGPPPAYNPSTETLASATSASASSSFRDQLLTLLGIPSHLTNRADRNLHFAYQKYQAYIQACQTLLKRVSEGTWPGKKPSSTELIELFVSKSMWFSHYRPAFSKVSNYPLMVEWLENGDDKPSDEEAWGVEQAAYSLTDLRKFVDNGTLVEVAKDRKKKSKDACLRDEFGKGAKEVKKGSSHKKKQSGSKK